MFDLDKERRRLSGGRLLRLQLQATHELCYRPASAAHHRLLPADQHVEPAVLGARRFRSAVLLLASADRTDVPLRQLNPNHSWEGFAARQALFSMRDSHVVR